MAQGVNVKYLKLVAVAIFCAGLAIAGCGDDDSDSGWSGPGSGRCENGTEAYQKEYSDAAVESSDVLAGIERCEDGSLHRYEAVECISTFAGHAIEDCGDHIPNCDEGEVFYSNGDYCICVAACASDADCADDQLCLCGLSGVGGGGIAGMGGIQRCIPATCRSDADCGEYRCGLGLSGCHGFERADCHTANDECEGSEQCDNRRCAYSSSEGAWVCDSWADCCET
jgi:hypothetical protein